MTTIVFEFAFSFRGRIFDPVKSCLSSKTVEALVCLKNWLSVSHDPIVINNYMDETEVFESSENFENLNLY